MVCSVPYSYGFFLQVDALRTGLSLPVRTRNALQNEFDNGTPAVLSARAHLLDVIFGDYCDKQFFLQADGSFHREYLDNYLANGYGSVIILAPWWMESLLYSLFDSQY